MLVEITFVLRLFKKFFTKLNFLSCTPSLIHPRTIQRRNTTCVLSQQYSVLDDFVFWPFDLENFRFGSQKLQQTPAYYYYKYVTCFTFCQSIMTNLTLVFCFEFEKFPSLESDRNIRFSRNVQILGC